MKWSNNPLNKNKKENSTKIYKIHKICFFSHALIGTLLLFMGYIKIKTYTNEVIYIYVQEDWVSNWGGGIFEN